MHEDPRLAPYQHRHVRRGYSQPRGIFLRGVPILILATLFGAMLCWYGTDTARLALGRSGTGGTLIIDSCKVTRNRTGENWRCTGTFRPVGGAAPISDVQLGSSAAGYQPGTALNLRLDGGNTAYFVGTSRAVGSLGVIGFGVALFGVALFGYAEFALPGAMNRPRSAVLGSSLRVAGTVLMAGGVLAGICLEFAAHQGI